MVSGFLLHGPRTVARRLRPAAVSPAPDSAEKPDAAALGKAVQLARTAHGRYRAWLTRVDGPGQYGRATEVDTLRGAARRYFQHPRPPVLVGAVAALGAARLVRGDLRRADAMVALSLIAAEPFVEWGIHRYVLHAPRTGRFGQLAYNAAGWGHAQHHQDPPNLTSMFMRADETIKGTAVALVAGAVGSPRVATGMFCAGAALLTYDWTHFLIHTSYRPKSALYKRIHRNHRLHHYRNERFWLGVTSPVADLVLRTNPPRDAVPVSPEAAHPELPPRPAPAGTGASTAPPSPDRLA